MTVILTCNLCRRVIAVDDADASRDGEQLDGQRVDICGACLREAAVRVADRLSEARLRAVVRRTDPVPSTVQERARAIRLPEYLTRRSP